MWLMSHEIVQALICFDSFLIEDCPFPVRIFQTVKSGPCEDLIVKDMRMYKFHHLTGCAFLRRIRAGTNPLGALIVLAGRAALIVLGVISSSPCSSNQQMREDTARYTCRTTHLL